MSNEFDNSDLEATEVEAVENEEAHESEVDELDANDTEIETEEQQLEQDNEPDGVPRGVEKKIGKLTARNKALQEEKEALERRLEMLASDRPKAQAQPEAFIQKPRKADFENEDDYIDAVIEFKQQERDAKAQKESQKREEEKRYIEMRKKALSMTEKGNEKHDDFEDVVTQSTHPIFANKSIAMAVLDSPNGDDVAYYLAKNPKEADRINNLPVHRALTEFGRLEASLASTEKQKTNAPEPMGQLKSSKTTTPKKLESLSQAEYERVRKESLKRNRWWR